jgi:O-antigen/teichoic acid export membrane protein
VNLKQRLVSNFTAGAAGKFSLVLTRFLQVPIILTAIGPSDYGVWLVVSALPVWLGLAGIGFGTVASTELTLQVAAAQHAEARRTYSNMFFLITALALMGVVFVIVVVPLIGWSVFFKVDGNRDSELIRAIFFLSMSVFLTFYGDLFGGRIRAAKKAYISILLSALRPWLDLLCMIIALGLSPRFDYLAAAVFVSTLIMSIVLFLIGRRLSPGLGFGYSFLSATQARRLFYKGCAYQALPAGNALQFQGMLLVVNHFMTPIDVALFGTARTLVRSINQIFELSNQVTWSEFSILLGEKRFVTAKRLHQISVGLTFLASIIAVILMLLFGPRIYSIWTGSVLKIDRMMLFYFLLPVPFTALWYTSCVVHLASNQYDGFAVRFLFANFLALCACCILTIFHGLSGAALSIFLVDILLFVYVFRKSNLILSGRSNLTY